jgi:hypothetical protein
MAGLAAFPRLAQDTSGFAIEWDKKSAESRDAQADGTRSAGRTAWEAYPALFGKVSVPFIVGC